MLTIHKENQPPRLIRLGHAPEVIEPVPVVVQVDSPPEPVKNTRGRKKMADKKMTDETGVKKISEEDAGTQGAIGSGGVNAPAQEKVPDKSQQSEQGKEE